MGFQYDESEIGRDNPPFHFPPLHKGGCLIDIPSLHKGATSKFPLMERGEVTRRLPASPYHKGRWREAPEGIREFEKWDRQGRDDGNFEAN